VVYPVLANEEMTTESQRYNCFIRNGGNAIQRLKVAILPLDLPSSGPVTHSGEILTTGKSHGKKPDRFSLNEITQGNETIFPNWQKESWQTFEETSGHVRPERVNKWPNSMTDM